MGRGIVALRVPTRRALVGALVVLLLAGLAAVHLAGRARGADVDRCARFAAGSVDRARAVTGSGERVVVIGDSWSAGLGLDRAADSWPSRLPGSVHVAGFSGSGFSALASECGRAAAFDARAREALRGGADLVVVEGGLNDHDRTDAEIRAGFARLMAALAGHRVVVVGPATAPARAGAVPRVDALLADLSADHGVGYVRTAGWTLDYLPDGLHLTPDGHRTFGDLVAAEVAQMAGRGGTNGGSRWEKWRVDH